MVVMQERHTPIVWTISRPAIGSDGGEARRIHPSHMLAFGRAKQSSHNMQTVTTPFAGISVVTTAFDSFGCVDVEQLKHGPM